MSQKTFKNLAIPLFLLLAVALGCVPPKRTDTAQGQNESKSAQPQLKLLSMRDNRQSEMFHQIVGEVHSVSGEKLESVNVVVNSYDKDGQLVTTDFLFLDYNPIMPGQTSPFKVMLRDNPAMDSYRVDFKFFAGAPIEYVDARPAKTETKKKK